MNDSYEFDAVDHFTTGAVGPKGQRVFMLQARRGDGVVTLKIEKQQVAALADRLEQLIADLEGAAVPDGSSAGDLVDPAEPIWSIGTLAVGVEAPDRVVVLAEELMFEDDEADPASASFRLDTGQVAAFITRAREIVAAGRAPCPFCGLPLEPGGEFCPCWN